MQVWDASTRKCKLTMSSHSQAVSCVRWGGEDLIYSASRDTVINVWSAQVGEQVPGRSVARMLCCHLPAGQLSKPFVVHAVRITIKGLAGCPL